MRPVIDILAIGQGIRAYDPFESHFVGDLRHSLGDWRDPLTFSEQDMIEPALRAGLYLEQGVDLSLSDMPAVRFHETIRVAGLASDDDQNDDDDVARAVAAFTALRRLERALREFIDRIMTDAFGPGWMKHRVPERILESWKQRKETALQNGEKELSLMGYADFSDYRVLIEKRDNWDGVFKHVFGRMEDIRESLQRLGPIRIATMHARTITLEDELLLRVESGRILKKIDTTKA